MTRFYAALCLDALLPLARDPSGAEPDFDAVVFSGSLRDLSTALINCNFWTTSPRTVHPMYHLLSKALPMRCQVRSLVETLRTYMGKDPAIRHMLLRIVQCSLLGNYEHVTVRPTFQQRMRVYGMSDVAPWCILIFFSLKEYIIDLMHYNPSMAAVVRRRYNWFKFEVTIIDTMDELRGRFAPTDAFFADNEEHLTRVNKLQLKYAYKTNTRSYHTFVTSMIKSAPSIPDWLQECLDRTAIQQGGVSESWLHQLGLSAPACIYVKSIRDDYRSGRIKTLRGIDLPERTKDILYAYHSAALQANNVHLSPLPQHAYDRQQKALAARYDRTVDSLPVYGCIHCKTFKGMVVTDHAKGKINTFAYGHSRVIVDDEFNCYCSNTKKPRCQKFPLMSFEMVGNVLQWYGKIILLCTQCGSPTYYRPEHQHTCGHCPTVDIQVVACSFCQKLRKGTAAKSFREFTMIDGTPKEKRVALCAACTRPWIADGQQWDDVVFALMNP